MADITINPHSDQDEKLANKSQLRKKEKK